jgi:hypothetical protein
VGPTGSARLKLEFPQYEYAPPIGHGDLFKASSVGIDIAVIVDGYFHQGAAIRHKEILWALGEGMDVIGASSMGALRAAELASFGMRGFGRIFQAYQDGEYDRDDDVVLAHGPAPQYQAHSIPTANFQWALSRARTITRSSFDESKAVAAVRALHYSDRTARNITSAVEDAAEGSTRLALQQLDSDANWDLKYQDARIAVAAVSGLGLVRRPWLDKPTLLSSTWRRTFDSSPSSRQVVTFGKLYDPLFSGRWSDFVLNKYPALDSHALNGELAEYWLTASELVELNASQRGEVILARAVERRVLDHLDTSDRLLLFPDWLDLSAECLRALEFDQEVRHQMKVGSAMRIDGRLLYQRLGDEWSVAGEDLRVAKALARSRGFRSFEEAADQSEPYSHYREWKAEQ